MQRMSCARLPFLFERRDGFARFIQQSDNLRAPPGKERLRKVLLARMHCDTGATSDCNVLVTCSEVCCKRARRSRNCSKPVTCRGD